jgi:hypothetical protein
MRDMANKYVDAIASSLEEFQNKLSKFYLRQTSLYRYGMGGLQGTDAFNKNIVGSGDRRDSKIDLVLN